MKYQTHLSILGLIVLIAGCSPEQDEADNSTPSAVAPPGETTQREMAPVVGNPTLGLPSVPIPANNPMSPEKVVLGEKLFREARFSADGKVSCSKCHNPDTAFTDSPRQTSEGFNGLTGSRNAPTVINAAFNRHQFWDGRRPDLESQSMDPPVNPVEGGLPDHDPILELVRTDPAYAEMFRDVFGTAGEDITMTQVSQAIAAFERTVISGNSAFDRYYFGGEKSAMSDAAIRGFDVYLKQGRCVSCHTIDQESALFTDHKFHNLGIGFKRIDKTLEKTAGALIKAERTGQTVDNAVLSNASISELGRFAIDRQWQDIGQFKTPTLRNVAATGPYMHDGSLATLEDVVTFYNDTVAPGEKGEPNAFQSGGIRPLNLTDRQKSDLVSFLEALTSPPYLEVAARARAEQKKLFVPGSQTKRDSQ